MTEVKAYKVSFLVSYVVLLEPVTSSDYGHAGTGSASNNARAYVQSPNHSEIPDFRAGESQLDRSEGNGSLEVASLVRPNRNG